MHRRLRQTAALVVCSAVMMRIPFLRAFLLTCVVAISSGARAGMTEVVPLRAGAPLYAAKLQTGLNVPALAPSVAVMPAALLRAEVPLFAAGLQVQTGRAIPAFAPSASVVPAADQQSLRQALRDVETAVSVSADSDPLAGRGAFNSLFDREAPKSGDAMAVSGVADELSGPPAPPVRKTNDLIDPDNLTPLLQYDEKTWTHSVNFHAHSRFSDGELTPTQLAQKFHEAGLKEVALTDHDNVLGQEEFVRAAQALGLSVHTGVELTGGAGIHIVVLDLDIYDAKLTALLHRIGEWRLVRAKAYVAHLNALPELKDKGAVITIEEVLAKTTNGQIERPQIAEVLVDKGIVKTKAEAFSKKFIGFDIKEPEVLKLEPKPEEVMDAVRSSGGRAFLVHPYTIPPGGPTAQQLLSMGMHGIEAYRSTQDASAEEIAKIRSGMTQYLLFAHDMDLLVMPGADFHGPSTPHLNHLTVPMPRVLADQLLKALGAPNK